MFSTSLAMLAASGLFVSGMAVQPTWVTDYSKALSAASTEHKPIAVFITSGKSAELLKDGAFQGESGKLLKEKFIALHVDTSTPAGKELASQFEIKQGLVISDSNGQKQALRYYGQLYNTELTQYLATYSKTNAVVTTTTAGAAPVAQPVVQPAGYYTPVYGTSSCPNCRTR